MNAGSTPLDYAPWRATTLGVVTERLERTAVLDLAGPLEGSDVLDVGCGDGTYALAAARAGAHVTGLDRSAAAVDAARARAESEGIAVDLQVGDAGALPFSADRFDVVFAVTVLCAAARILEPVDPFLGRATRLGAAFVAIAARKPQGRS